MADHAGWLQKKGGVGGAQWQKRWFAIKNGSLYWYAAPSEDKEKGSVALLNTNSAEHSGHEFGFSLSGPHLPKAYVLAAPSAADRTEWLKKMSDASRKSAEADEKTLFGQKARVSDFDVIRELGSGAFGKVLEVKHKSGGDRFAMKVMNKDKIIKNGMVQATKLEKSIMSTVNHPFIVKLHYAFHTKENLYLVMDVLEGGELFDQLESKGAMSEERAKLIGAEICTAISHLHGNGIIYRDLKPENLVLDKEGHCVLTDFGLAKTSMVDQKTYTFCGTPEYMAPEVIKGTGHGLPVDWWTFGILVYEMLVGLPPFYTDNPAEMFKLILNKPLEFPDHVSPTAKDLITQLLERDPDKRLSDPAKVKQHKFFEGIDWEKLLRREYKVPDR